MSTPFTGREGRWQARLGTLRDVVRQELVARQLAGELAAPPVPVIDLGCGRGTQALRLARRGYPVTGVDAADPGPVLRVIGALTAPGGMACT